MYTVYNIYSIYFRAEIGKQKSRHEKQSAAEVNIYIVSRDFQPPKSYVLTKSKYCPYNNRVTCLSRFRPCGS